MKCPASICYLPLARQDLVDIFDYLACQNMEAAKRLLDVIDHRVSCLADFPCSGVVPKDPRLKMLGYRMLIIENYLIFYTLPDDTTVEIRRVLHGSRNYSFLL